MSKKKKMTCKITVIIHRDLKETQNDYRCVQSDRNRQKQTQRDTSYLQV